MEVLRSLSTGSPAGHLSFERRLNVQSGLHKYCFWYIVSSEGWRSLETVWVGLFSGNDGENFASVAQVIRVGLKRSLWEAWGVSYGFGEREIATDI